MESRDKKPEEKEWSWETDILAHYSFGIDVTQIEERLKLTPTERLERMRQPLERLEEAKRRRDD